MKIERTKNAGRNIFFGFFLKGYQIVIPFIMRTVLIYTLGMEYTGLNGLFSSILSVLSLAELGVGSAMVFSMYRPIAEDDETTLCALLKLYKIYYTIIGAIIGIAGLILTPFIPYLIKSDVPDGINIYVLYLINLLTTVLSYWIFAYRSSVLQAHQRDDVISKVTIITSTIQYILQLIVLIVFHNYYYFIIVALLSRVLTNVVTAIVSKKLYPMYEPIGKLDKSETNKINKRIKDVFTAKLGGTVVAFADTIVISAFLGLTTLAIYQNYFLIINSITAFMLIINDSIVAGVGNSLVLDSIDKNYKDFEKFSFILFWIMGFCITCFICLMQPFMKIWIKDDKLLLPFALVILFCVYFYGDTYEKALSLFKDAGGIWHQDRYRPLIYGLSNLVLNIILVQYIGLYGIILSTIITCFFISIPWITRNVFKLIFKRSIIPFLKQVLLYTLVAIITCFITYKVCSIITLPQYISFIVKCIICVILPNAIFFLVYRKNELFKSSLEIVKKLLRLN